VIHHLMAASQNICRNYPTTDNSPGMALSRGRSAIAQEDQHSDELDQENLRWVCPSLSCQSCYSNTADQPLWSLWRKVVKTEFTDRILLQVIILFLTLFPIFFSAIF